MKLLYSAKNAFAWSVVLSCIIGVAASSGPIVLSAAGVLMGALQEEFGWNRAEISLSVTIYTLLAAVCVPFVGKLIDHAGARRIVLPAIALSALALGLTVFVKELWHFYVVVVLFSAVGATTTSLPYVRIISMWFDRRRGLYLGIVAAGIGLGFAAVPVIMQYLLHNVGWRGAYLGIAAALIFIILPLLYLLLQDNPAEFGLLPDGLKKESSAPASDHVEGLTLSESLKTLPFWLLLGITFVYAFVFNGMAVHLVPLLKDNGIEASQAVGIASTMGLSLFLSRIGIGLLLDVYLAPRLAIATFLLGSAGLVLVTMNISMSVNVIAAILIGIGIGAETDIVSYMTSRYFGLRAFGKIYGLIFAFFYPGTGLGPLALGIAFEQQGTYTVVLHFYAALCVLVTATFLFFGPYRYERAQA